MEITPVTDLGSVLETWDHRPLPERVTLNNTAFTAAFEAFRRREEEVSRKPTFETFSDQVGINERVLRKARAGHVTLPRHQVLKIAERLDCAPRSIVEHPVPAEFKAQDERDRKDRIAWPVPLREVASWVEFVEHLGRANAVRPCWKDDVLSLTAAPAIDAFKAALRYSSQIAKDNPAISAAALKDAADDLRAYDLHVLAGRFLARREGDNAYGTTDLVHVLEVWIRRETEDLAHIVDRSSEPMSCSELEDQADNDEIDEWLAWEGKRRLFLWRGDDTE